MNLSKVGAAAVRRLVTAASCAALALGFAEIPGATSARPLESIREAGTLNVCANADALPFSSQDPARPGFQLEIADALAKRLGVKLSVSWIVFVRHARRAQCDAILGAIVQGQEGLSREAAEEGEAEGVPKSPAGAAPEISHPYAGSGYVLLVSRTALEVQHVEDIGQRGGRIGVEHGSWPHYLLSKRSLPTTSYRTQADIVDAIAKGEILAGLVTDPVVGWFLKQRPDAVRVADRAPDRELRWDVAIRMLSPDQALMDAVNSAIDRLLAEHTIQGIFSKYGIPYIPPGGR